MLVYNLDWSVETTAAVNFGLGLGSCRLSDFSVHHPHDFVQSHANVGGEEGNVSTRFQIK